MDSEYPDTTWVGYPAAYGVGRDGKSVRLSVVHYTAGAAGPGMARAGAIYDKRRTDGTSTHCFHDSVESVQEILCRDRANAAFAKGNRLGIQHELCATNSPTDWWMHGIGWATMNRAAKAVAIDCQRYGLEPRRLSVAEVRRSWYDYPNGPRGICGHVDITRAFPEDHGSHTDPGDGFPWTEFVALVKHYIVSASTEEDDMNRFVAHIKWEKVEGWVWSDGNSWRSIPDWDTKLKCSGISGKPDVEVVSENQLWIICGVEETRV